MLQATQATLQILLALYGGQVLIPFIRAAETAGFAGQTARNLLSRGEFPIPTVLVGRRRFVHLADLAAWIDALRVPKPKRGAHTKKDRIEVQVGAA